MASIVRGYALTSNDQTLTLPVSAIILSTVKLVDGYPTIYALMDKNSRERTRPYPYATASIRIIIVGQDELIEEDAVNLRHIGSYWTGERMRHVFEVSAAIPF